MFHLELPVRAKEEEDRHRRFMDVTEQDAGRRRQMIILPLYVVKMIFIVQNIQLEKTKPLICFKKTH